MVMRYGMEEKLGNLSYEAEPAPFLPTGAPPTARRYSEETARDIDRAVRDISQRAHASAVAILTRHRDLLEEGARQLLRKETLTEAEITALVGERLRGAAAAPAQAAR
jgi:cell division protease FtsH